MTQNLGISGRIFKLDNLPTSDICCQVIKKYNKVHLHVGSYKINVMGGAPESFDSSSWVAKKGLAGNKDRSLG